MGWWTVVGISLDIAGTGVLAFDVIVYVSRKRAVEDHGSLVLPVGSWSEANRPEVIRARRAAWRGLIGYGLLVVGFFARCTLRGREHSSCYF
jgi:hypothetical protein